MTSSEKNIAAEDVKHRLFETLKARGVLDSLKSRLRKQLIWELQDSTGVPVFQSSISSADTDKCDGVPLCQRIANSLVVEHLKRCKYEYSLSTFLPESGTSQDKVFCLKDILNLLHINPQSKLYTNLEHSLNAPGNATGFLWQFMKELASVHTKHVHNVETQTEDTLQNKTLEEKLCNVEKEFSEKLKLFQLDKNQGTEEKLITLQRNYELQKKKELQDEIKRFKTNEISRLRMEEREKYEKEVKKIQQEYDQEYKLKSQALRVMEKETLESLGRLKEVHESEAYAERQKFLYEMNSFKGREDDLRKRVELQDRTKKIEDERLANEVNRLRILEDALNEKENFQAERYKTDVERFKRDYQQQFASKQEAILRQESSLKLDRSKFDAEKNKYLECLDELDACKERNIQLQASLEASKLLLDNANREKIAMDGKLAAMKDYETLKQKEVILKKDIEHLTQKLTETNVHCKEQEKRHQSFVKEFTNKPGKPSKEVLALRKEINDVKDKHKVKEKSLNETRKDLENRLHSEIQRANHFQSLYENQLSSQHLLESEVEHLKTIQQQTERLLSMELRHQRTNNTYVSSPSREKSNLPGNISASQPSEISTRKFDDSSGVDESSLASLAEDKKLFQKLEKEAEALDASYRDFQNRVRKPENQTFASVPNATMTFRRLPSYHSTYHTSQLDHADNSKETWVNSTAPARRFRPLEPYDGSGISGRLRHSDMLRRTRSSVIRQSSHPKMTHATSKESREAFDEDDIESGQLPAEENAALTINDLAAHDTVATKVLTVHGERTSQSAAILHRRPDQQQDRSLEEHPVMKTNGEHDAGTRPGTNAPLNKPRSTVAMAPAGGKSSSSYSGHRDEKRHENILFDRRNSMDTSEHSGGSLEDVHESQVTTGMLDHIEVQPATLDSMWERQHVGGGLAAVSDHLASHATSLDMEELEIRRHREQEQRKQDSTMAASGSDKSLSFYDNQSEELLSNDEQMGVPIEENRGDLGSTFGLPDGVGQESPVDNMPDKGDQGGTVDEMPDRVGQGGTVDDMPDRGGQGGTIDNMPDERRSDEPTIDPVMLKYMEMIKQRREDEDKETQDEQSDHLAGDGDNDVSVGKLSDEDFDWE